MSSIGTGTAAGVAQTAYQASQTAGRRDKQARETTQQAQQQEIRRLPRAEAAAEAADSDEQLPDRQPPGYDSVWLDKHAQKQHDQDAEQPASAESDPDQAAGGESSDDEPEDQPPHIDVCA